MPRPLRLPVLLAAAACLLAPSAAHAAAQYPGGRQNSFARAERLREALEGRPEQQRTRAQYDRVLDAYRAIYHGDPASPKADASVAAVADLLAEEGRIFQDTKALHDAVGQYEFLRHQYPGSRFRFTALLTEGEIYQRDLGDTSEARGEYEDFLRLYPQNPLGVEARAELRNIRRAENAGNREERRPRSTGSMAEGRPRRSEQDTSELQSREFSTPRQEAQRSTETAAAPSGRTRYGSTAARLEENDIPPPASSRSSYGSRGTSAEGAAPPETAQPGDLRMQADLRMNAPPPPASGRMPLITGIRHWSTPVYTRVAIDLQQEVRYQAVRVPSPDRIFFDLYGAKLSPELAGRSVEVIDDGFLSRIRAAQYSGDVTRIVLDVNSVSDYSAFFLPNPPRLIIDVHGRRNASGQFETARKSAPPARPNPVTAFTPTMTPSRGSSLADSAHSAVLPGIEPAPAANAQPDSALSDVAKLSSQPNQVRATTRPTTAPVVASVAGTTPASQPEYSSRRNTRAAKPSAAIRASDDVPPAVAGAPGVAAPAALQSDQHLPNSMVRALGLKINRIVIDAGHGGHDSGTLGPGGLEEKDVVLDVALRLGKLLKQRLGADVIYTRSDDTFIPLESRTAIANQAQADLFISIHANSSPDPDARGVETYYLNFTSSADALEVAARENAVSDESIHQLSDLVRKIALQDKINESRAFAADVQQSLYSGLEDGNPGLRDRGVKKAPFVVLIGANMPSILAEISFLTNPDDAHELREPRYRERIAESLYRGVAQYVSSLNGVRLAQATTHTASTE